MSFTLQSLELNNFRCYQQMRFKALSSVVIFVGENAVGKTNVMEAIQLMATGRSFRHSRAEELVRWGQETCHVQADFYEYPRRSERDLSVVDGKKRFAVGGKARPASELLSSVPVVAFTPDDLQMIKGASSARRMAIDELATQQAAAYGGLRGQYAKTLKQRNVLLKEGAAAGPLFDTWNESLAVNGSRLLANRVKLFQRLKRAMEAKYAELVPGEQLEVLYAASWDRFDEAGRQLENSALDYERLRRDWKKLLDIGLLQQKFMYEIRRLAPVEEARRTSLVGPHKDELVFLLNGRDARTFASQGQQRSLVLAWKLAEVQVIEDLLERKPLLLLDDVMSELDAARRRALMDIVMSGMQTFITTTNLGYFSADILVKAQVIELPQGQ